ncbi:hypothetical protein [Fodinicola feengrottensis]|uniref:hypothetical protein n=1 Tax=Fodinicola feengrottensis TaxID=435914 RepID=UPI0013D6FD3A|nr:hypothetical protein [Fodinicola feengrottensis]
MQPDPPGSSTDRRWFPTLLGASLCTPTTLPRTCSHVLGMRETHPMPAECQLGPTTVLDLPTSSY